MKSRAPFRVLLFFLLTSACQHDLRGEPPIRVAAAADLTHAFGVLARDFERETGRAVAITFGSSGLLAKQLRQGAPFDVFAAASARFIDDVVQAGVCDGRSRAPYGRGRLAIWSRDDRGEAKPPATLSELAEPRFKRIAIANPEHAPYGKAAREALQSAGIWPEVQARLVYAENVRQALQLAETGNVEAAIVALSLVLEEPPSRWLALPESLHQPLDQELVACTRGARTHDGRRFAAYVNAPRGRTVMKRFGFVLAHEAWVQRP